MKICIIGNSHTACLKTAWDVMNAEVSEHTLTFFASPGASMSELKLDEPGRRLIAGNDTLASALAITSGGMSAIALADYDAFLVMAQGFSYPQVPSHLSAAAAGALVDDLYRNTLSARFVGMIRCCSKAPIFVGCMPQRLAPEPGAKAPSAMPIERVAQLCNQANLAHQLVFIPQPPATLDRGWYTQPQFVKGAPRLVNKPEKLGKTFNDKSNNVHMNTDYGRFWLEQFFAALPKPSNNASVGPAGR